MLGTETVTHRLMGNYLCPGVFGFFPVPVLPFSFLSSFHWLQFVPDPLELEEAPSPQTYFAWQYQVGRRDFARSPGSPGEPLPDQLVPTSLLQAGSPAAALALSHSHPCLFQRSLGVLKWHLLQWLEGPWKCVLLGPVTLRPESARFSLIDIFALHCNGSPAFLYTVPGIEA